MIKKNMISVLIAFLLTVLVFNIVIAGLTSDTGTLETDPPAGGANWLAWLDNGTSPPTEVMTEDAFNSAAGLDTGYTDDGWFMQVRNFNYPSIDDNDLIQMSFGGLGDHSGKHWYYSFYWEGGPEDPTQTTHGEVDLAFNNGPSCPLIYPVEVEEFATYKNFSVSFFGQPNTTYLVYRSTTPSGAVNGESNGRYRFRDSVDTDSIGNGLYEDPQNIPLTVNAWYVVFYFDDSGDGQHGCHSEPVNPTNVRVMNFEAEYKASEQAVILNWETASEMDVVGFNVLRSESEDGEKNKLNGEDLIAATPGGTGSSYSYVDSDVEFGHTYYYWLEIIGNGTGRDEILGPRPAPVFYQLFLPLFN